MAILGHNTIEASAGSIQNQITGSLFTATEDGTTDDITVAVKCPSPAHNNNMKCMLYNHTTLALIGTTEERLVAVTLNFAWETFNFAAPKPTFTNGTPIIIMAWAQDTSSGVQMAYHAGAVAQSHYDVEAYGAPPNPLVPGGGWDREDSIFCNYTPSAGGVSVKKGSNLANTMTTMLNTKMLYNFIPRQVT